MTVTCKAEESLTCSCVDVGTIIDGSDCSVDIHQTYANKAEAEAALNRFIEPLQAIMRSLIRFCLLS